jgi:hypothetical protein
MSLVAEPSNRLGAPDHSLRSSEETVAMSCTDVECATSIRLWSCVPPSLNSEMRVGVGPPMLSVDDDQVFDNLGVQRGPVELRSVNSPLST